MGKAIGGIYVPIRGDYRQLQADLDAARAQVKSSATSMSDALGNIVGPDKLSKGLNRLVADLAQVERASKVGSNAFKDIGFSAKDMGERLGLPEKRFAELQTRMLQNQAANSTINSLRRIGSEAGLTAAEIRKLGREMGLSEDIIRKATTSGGGGAMPVALGVASAVAAIAMVGVQAARASFEANINAQKLQATYKTIEGSVAGANQQLLFLRGESERLGTQFQESAAAAKTFFAAGKGTALEGSMRSIFSAVTEAGTALSLSQEDLSGVFLALGQMISKGKVQAEELRGQLGERLPGAFGLAAKAMGVTTGELDKMLEQGKVLAEDLLPKLADAMHEKFGKAAMEAAKGGAQEVNRMSSEWESFKANVLDSEGIVSAIRSVTVALKSGNRSLIERQMAAKGMPGGQIIAHGDSIDISYPDEELRAYLEYGTTDRSQIYLIEQARQRSARENYEVQANERAIGKASSLGKSFLQDTPDSKRAKIIEESQAALKAQQEARERDLENAERYDKRIVQINQETARKLSEIGKAETNERRSALESIREELAKANDISGDGSGNLAGMEKKLSEFARKLGVATPEVRAYADVLAYAREHMGKTPAEIAKVNAAIEDQIDLLNEEIYARLAVSDLYGDQRSDQLAMLQARTTAERAYLKAKKDGADEATAAYARLLTLTNEQSKLDEHRNSNARTLAQNYAGPAYEAQRKSIEAAYEAAKQNATDIEAIERGKNQRLAEVEEARLQATGKAQDAMAAALRRYSREAGDDGANAFNAWTNSIKSAEDALTQFAANGEMNFSRLFTTIREEIIRTQMVRPALSWISGGIESGGLWAGIKSMFSGVFHDGGLVGSGGASRMVSPLLFADAPRFHNGLAADEFPAILQTGERVLSRREVAQGGGSGGPITVKLVNQSGQQIQASSAKVTQDSQGMLVTVFLDAVQRNVGGARTGLQAALGGG